MGRDSSRMVALRRDSGDERMVQDCDPTIYLVKHLLGA
jgi:hypothetical protein